MMKLVGIFILAIAVVAHGNTTDAPSHTTPAPPQTTNKPADTTVILTTTPPQTTTTDKQTTKQPDVTTALPATTAKQATTQPDVPTTASAVTTASKVTTAEPKTTHAAATTGSDMTTASEVTTTAPVITTPDTPQPPKNPWFVNDTNGVCIIMTMGARMSVEYTTKNNKTSNAQFDLPIGATVEGSCNNGSDPQTIKFTFHQNWTLTFHFKHDGDNVVTSDIDLVYDLDPTVFKDVNDDDRFKLENAGIHNQTLFKAQKTNSYVCNSDSEIKLDGMVNMTTVDLQVQAFHTANDMNFGTTQQCDADSKTSNIVPIAVGAALAALVVIVLIAYLISRNKNKGGYESV